MINSVSPWLYHESYRGRTQWKGILSTARAKAKEDQEENKILLQKMTAEDKKKIKAITKQLKDEDIPDEEKERLLESLKVLYRDIKDR